MIGSHMLIAVSAVKPDTSVSCGQNMDYEKSVITVAACNPMVDAGLGAVVEPCVSVKNSCCASCTSGPSDVVLVPLAR